MGDEWLWELRVMAFDPPKGAVRVMVNENDGIELAVPANAGPLALRHLIVQRADGMTALIHGQTDALPGHEPDDVVLADVVMPSNTAMVVQAQITDRRTFKAGHWSTWGVKS